jgi:hypothetical protein
LNSAITEVITIGAAVDTITIIMQNSRCRWSVSLRARMAAIFGAFSRLTASRRA